MSTPPLFLAPAESLLGASFVLAGPEGRHAAQVRRLRVGERIDVADGAGLLAECVVETVQRDQVGCAVLRRRTEPAPEPRLVVVQALAKGGRDEAAVEAMTEAGVDEFVPWPAARSIARWRADRWTATAREAAKQARRARVPSVRAPASTAEVAARVRAAAFAAVLHEQAERPLHEAVPPRRGELVVVVGPEGGLTEDELGELTAAGAGVYRLGPHVLRSATAGVVAATLLLAGSGRWDGRG